MGHKFLIKQQNKEQELRIDVPQEKIDKFYQVFKYILYKTGGDPYLGKTKIFKLLYFIDFDFFEKYEKQLMGLKYIKQEFGPLPVVFDKAVENLKKQKEVEEIKRKVYTYDQVKYILTETAKIKIDLLSAEELQHINQEIERFKKYSAQEISSLSHKDLPWLNVDIGKELSYPAVFYRTKETSVRKYGF